MKPACPRCGLPLDPEGVCASCAYADVFDDKVASAFPLEQEEAAERIAKRRGLVDLEPLGRGGMGFVYRARQVQLDRDVALKLFAAGSPERFEREARVLASLSHPNIVAIHDFGTDEGLPYFVMEFMDGPSLRTIIDMGDLSPRRALEILEQIGRALEYAHGRGIIHRDIKPENILTSVDGHVKVGDFGIARLADQEGDTGSGSGTPAYMAPERLHIPGAADERSDIYSLGALAREMLQGSGDDRLHEIVRRALDPEPDRRFQSVTEFLAGLRTVSTPGATPPKLSLNVCWRRLALSRLFWFLLASSVVEIAGLILWLTTMAPIQPQDLFDSLLDDPIGAINVRRALTTLTDVPLEEIDALLAREASSPDLRRAAMALEVAHRRKRESSIPPEVRIQILRALPWNVSPLGAEGGLYVTNRPYLLNTALKDGGPELGRRFVEELASGSAPQPDLPLLTIGVAWTADGAVCLDLRKRLIETPRPANAYLMLTALASRLDIPLPAGPQVTPVYERYLPELLDARGEAIWEVAARLARELPETEDLADWKSVYLPLRGGPLTPANLATGRGIQWPFTSDGYVRGYEGSIRADQWRKGHEYLMAVMTRWHQTGRITLPHYPYGVDTVLTHFLQFPLENITRPLERERYNKFARAILLPGPSMPWECVYLGFTTLAGRPEVLARGRGRGNVDFTGSFEIPAPGTPVRGSVGIGSLVPRPGRPVRAGTVTLSGAFSSDSPGVLRFDGGQSSRDPYGGGSGSAGGLSAAGETMVVHCQLYSAYGRNFRSGYAWLLFPDPGPGMDPETRWRVGIRAAAARLAASDLTYIRRFEVSELTTFTMATSIPEAAEGLRKLWERRTEFEPNDPVHGSMKAPDHIGASLLMAGDPTPLSDKGLVKRLHADLASRIFLFSPSIEVRTAVAEQARQPLGRDDAKAVAKILDARGDTTSPLALEAAAGMARGRKDLLLEIAPYIGVAAFLLILGWFPRNNGYLPALAGSLVYTGLIFRLLKLQVGEVIWIPVVGDLLLLISAFLYGSVALRVLTTGMMVTAILQLMLPHSGVLGYVTFALLCGYLAVASLDALVRQLPGHIPRRFGVAFLSTWWLLILPCGVMTIAALFQTAPSLASATGALSAPAAVLLSAALVLPPLWLMNFERRRRLGEATLG